MPVFNWVTASGNPIISNRFWIYWAVTLPLTFLVLLIWIVWLVYTTRKNRAADIEARGKTYKTD